VTSWATHWIEKLKRGETITLNPRGNSMTPKIYSGQQVTVAPLKPEDRVELGDIVMCRVHGMDYLHLVTSISGNQETFQISNNHGHCNGTTTRNKIYGKVIKIG